MVRDPYARWCGRGGIARCPPILITRSAAMTGCRKRSVPGKGRRRSGMRGTAPMSFAVITARTPAIASAALASTEATRPWAMGLRGWPHAACPRASNRQRTGRGRAETVGPRSAQPGCRYTGSSRSWLVGLAIGDARFEHRFDDRDIARAAAQMPERAERIRSASASGSSVSSACAVVNIPGVQKPHCKA